MFFPFNIDNSHWVLLVCDISHGKISYWDPLGRPLPTILKNKWILFLKIKNRLCSSNLINLKDIKFVPPCENYELQEDGFNCGIFVDYYVIKLITGKMSSVFLPNNFWKSLKTNTLQLLNTTHHALESDILSIFPNFDPTVTYLCQLRALTMSEWTLVMSRDECNFTLDYNIDLFLRKYEMFCEFDTPKPFETKLPPIFNIKSVCKDVYCSTKFEC